MNFKSRKMSESDKLVYTLSIIKSTTNDEVRIKELNNILTRLLSKMGRNCDED